MLVFLKVNNFHTRPGWDGLRPGNLEEKTGGENFLFGIAVTR
jgi:hypothetical protein